jgi:rRNA maturation RNase YbeY
MAPRIVTILNLSGRPIRKEPVRKGVEAALNLGKAEEGEVTILFADNAYLQDLNREHRNLDEPTDVLTFPAPPNTGQLGDIAISIDFVQRGAHARRVPLYQEAAYLAIHGALHLAGLDDQTEAEFRLMINAMNEAAIAAGLRPDENWQSLPHGEDSP